MRRKHFLASWLMLVALAVQTFAGDVFWTGNAPGVPQVTTFTVTGVWDSPDTSTITVNGKPNTVTYGSVSNSITDVAAAIAAALNSTDTSTTDIDIISDATKNIGGQMIAEFKDFKAVAVGSVVTLTGTTDGRPFIATSSEVTAGTGSIADATPTSASGPNHWTTATNWDTGVIPALGDDVYFTQGDVDCLYGLDDSGKDLNSFTREAGYTGRIGLPPINNDMGEPYTEYRTTHLQIEPETGGDFYRIHGGPRTNINTFGEAGNVTIESGNVSLITTTGVITLTALGGNVELGNKGEDACVLGTVICGDPAGGAANVNISKSCTGTINLTVYNGTTVVDAAMGGTATVYGTLIVESGAQTTISARMKGKLIYNGPGTLTTLNTYDTAWADFSKDTRAKTVTNLNMWDKSRYSDPFGVVTLTNGIDLEDGGLQNVTLETVIGRTWTPSGL